MAKLQDSDSQPAYPRITRYASNGVFPSIYHRQLSLNAVTAEQSDSYIAELYAYRP